jgi:hypothetical protein
MQFCWGWLPLIGLILVGLALMYRLATAHYIGDGSKPFSGLGWNWNWRRRNFDAAAQRWFTWLRFIQVGWLLGFIFAAWLCP